MICAGYAWNYKDLIDKYYIKLQEKAKARRNLRRLFPESAFHCSLPS